MTAKIEGIVIEGNSLGRTLGVPTANIALEQECGLTNGVYAAHLTIDDVKYCAVANIGRKPTVERDAPRGAEIHIIGFEGNLYGRHLEVWLDEFLRSEQRFDSIESLQTQIKRDIETVKNKNLKD